MENTSTSDTALIHKGGSADTQGTSSRAPGPGAQDGGGESRGELSSVFTHKGHPTVRLSVPRLSGLFSAQS